MPKKKGHISREVDAHPLDHEMSSAEALAKAGFDVRFIRPNYITHSPDVYINNRQYEIKSPVSRRMHAIDNCLRKTVRQAGGYAVIDSQRVRDLTDHNIETFLTRKLKEISSLKDIIFINRRREVIMIRENIK